MDRSILTINMYYLKNHAHMSSIDTSDLKIIQKLNSPVLKHVTSVCSSNLKNKSSLTKDNKIKDLSWWRKRTKYWCSNTNNNDKQNHPICWLKFSILREKVFIKLWGLVEFFYFLCVSIKYLNLINSYEEWISF